MTVILLCTIFFAIAYAVKGGQSFYVFKNWENARSKNKVLERLLDGKVISTVLVVGFLSFITTFHQINVGQFDNASLSILSIAVAWLLSVAPSVWAEYAGMMGDKSSIYHLHERGGLHFAFKKCIQRGVWIGALMTLATGYVPFILASFLYMPIAYAALRAGRKWITVDKGWAISEVLIGAFVYGVPFGFYLSGLLR